MRQKDQAITLIALVITIIVLLILAGVTITTLTGENGILNKASEASEQTKQASSEEQVQIAVVGSIGTDGNIEIDTLNKELEKINAYYDGSPISDSNKIESLPAIVTVDGYNVTIKLDGSITKNENIKEYTKEGVPIPKDFYYVEGTKDTGVVISDVEGDDLNNSKGGNQFVWVPVDNYSDFVRRAGYNNGKQESLTSSYGEADATGNNTNSGVTETETTKIEAQEMYASVEENKGFYIGRYEAGMNDNGNVVFKKGEYVYNGIQWSANGNMQETDGVTGGAVELARNFAKSEGYTSVTSTLVYGVQWDAVMKWIETIPNPNVEGKTYIQNSTGMGWYRDNYFDGNLMNQTGIDVDENKSNCVNNIYDLAGNIFEWTMESVDNSRRVFRGGYYNDTGLYYPASSRGSNFPTNGTMLYGFRVTLYL